MVYSGLRRCESRRRVRSVGKEAWQLVGGWWRGSVVRSEESSGGSGRLLGRLTWIGLEAGSSCDEAHGVGGEKVITIGDGEALIVHPYIGSAPGGLGYWRGR